MDVALKEKEKEKYDGYVLMKFTSSYKYQQDFLDGKLFFNTSDFFAGCDNDGQGDPDEGNTFVISQDKPELISANLEEVNGKMAIVVRDYTDNPEEYKTGTVWSLSKSENRNRKLICLYTVYLNIQKNEIKSFPEQMGTEFGEYGILILDRQQFFERVCNAICKVTNVKSAQMGFVEYLDEDNIRGIIDWHPFLKMPRFEYQNEFRISFLTDTDEPLMLELDKDLRDIAVPIMAGDVKELVMKEHRLYYPICNEGLKE